MEENKLHLVHSAGGRDVIRYICVELRSTISPSVEHKSIYTRGAWNSYTQGKWTHF